MAGRIRCARHGRQMARMVSVAAWSQLGDSVQIQEVMVEDVFGVVVLDHEAPRTRVWSTLESMDASVQTFPVCSVCFSEKLAGGTGPFILADIMATKARMKRD